MANQTLASLAITMRADSAQLVQQFGEARRSVQRFGETTSRVAKRAAIAYAAIAAIGKIKETTQAVVGASATFESLNASLETVFASTERAAAKFDELRQFAAETPSTIEEVTQAAILMRSMGLDPSIESMESISNTAAAMGKTVLDFTHAIADAITFEMERLKEFGITAKQNADTIDFMFQGVKTTVKRDAESIQNYLLEIGNTTFAGGMERQAETLNGKFSQLSGAVQNLAATFADATGLTQATKDATVALTNMANNATAAIEKITLGDTIADLRGQIRELNKDLKIGQRIMEESDGKQGSVAVENIKAQKEAIKEKIKALTEEQNAIISKIKEQEAVEEEARQKRLDAIALEAEQKRIADEAEALRKEKQKAFGGDPEEIFARMQEAHMTELELLDKNFEEKRALFDKFREHEIGTEKSRNKLMLDEHFKYFAQRRKLEEAANKDNISDKKRFMNHVLQNTKAGGKILLAQQKYQAIQEALVEAKKSILSAYRWGNSIGGPVLGSAFAATAAAVSASMVADIINPGGGSSASTGGGGGAPSVPDVTTPGLEDVAANDEPQTTKTITVSFEGEGELVPRSVLRELAEELNSLDDSNVRISI